MNTTIEENNAIPKLLVNTRTHKRSASILEVADAIQKLLNNGKSKNEVANIIGIGIEMINKFLSVYKLPVFIQNEIINRNIDSVALAFYLSKLNEQDQKDILPLVLNKEINSSEIKTFLPFRNKNLNKPITELYNQHLNSKNIKVSVIRISESDTLKDLSTLKKKFIKYLPELELIDLIHENKNIDIKITKKGEKILRKKAKENNQTFLSLIQEIIK